MTHVDFAALMILSRRLLALTLAVAACSITSAAPPPDPGVLTPHAEAFWRSAAVVDVEAAYRMLREDHPGAVPEVGDRKFRETLVQAHALAAHRAAAVSSFSGYAATLAAFANAFADKHVRSRPLLEIARPDWAGLIIGRRGSHWIVADAEQGSPVAGLNNSELVSCDGRAADDWARQVLGGFRADWSVDAQKAQTAPWLLVSEGNPFVPRPRSCLFTLSEGRSSSVTLDWRSISRSNLAVRMDKVSSFGAAGFGVRRVGVGYWIALQDLLDKAQPIVAAVRAQASAIRAAPFVVLDLRGNGGGSSTFGDQIAGAILGTDYVTAVQGPPVSDCGGEVIRVSDDNIRALQKYRDELGPKRGPEFTRIFVDILARMQAARAAGRAFSGALTCPKRPESARGRVAPEYRGKLFVLTDGLCFSSCLDVVESWREFGAIQVGQPTDANTHYTEVRDDLMPSGLSTFSTMMGIDLSSPMRVGPFTPKYFYDGDIRDTVKVETWVLNLASQLAPPRT